ncbi:hypothetical protein CMUST_01900 [Corynebacterium mustelae]|uniref:Uncharacterized protein n=1 Tax=Corynebacterium mustelae TaxID=571915 RepID=A0A0G3GW38_9CORY|nr:hypothetical protein [Corynebacterium mustelae]AKK04725.1 hypothetical protein CMUST_01900 [Corynebacterium mustelae]
MLDFVGGGVGVGASPDWWYRQAGDARKLWTVINAALVLWLRRKAIVD